MRTAWPRTLLGLVLTHPALAALGAGPAGPAGEAVRVACVGDSITFGADLKDRAAESYPSVLQELLGGGYAVGNYGVCGATLLRKGELSYWDTPEFKAAADSAPGIVVIMLGTNDSWPGNWAHGEDWPGDLADMLDRFLRLPSKPRVWVCTSPPIFGMLRALSNRVLEREIIPALRRVAQEKGVPVIDVHEALRGQEERFPDAVHPDARGAEIIARTVFEAISAAEGARHP